MQKDLFPKLRNKDPLYVMTQDMMGTYPESSDRLCRSHITQYHCGY